MKLLAAVAGLALLAACQPYPPPPPPPQHFVAPMPPPPPAPMVYPDPEPPRYVERRYRRYERRASRQCPRGYVWVHAHQRTVGVYGQGEIRRSTKTIPGRCVRT